MAMTGGTSVLVHTGYGQNGDLNYPIRLYVYYKISQNVTANTSTITCGMYVTTPSTNHHIDWTYGTSYVGTTALTFSGKTGYVGGTIWLVENKSFTVNHNANGTGSATIYWKWNVNSTWGGFIYPSGSFNITLPNIPRISKPSVSVNTLNFGSAVTIYTNRQSTSFTHRLYYKYGTLGWTEITSSASVGDSYAWTVPTTLINQIPSASKLDITICCSTYNGSNWLGEDYAYITATVPTTSAYYPTIGGIAWTKTSSEPSTWPMTQNVSKGTMAMTGVSGAYGSTIKSYSLTFAGYSSTSASLTVPNIASSGKLKAIAKVTDTRERSFTKEVEFTVTAYSKPTLTISAAYRSNANSVEDAYGEYMYVKASASVSAVGNNSLQSLVLKYKKRSDTTYTSVTLTSGTAKLVAMSSDYTWDWVITAADLVSTVSNNGSISTGEVILDILANGKGIGFGKVAENEGFDSAWPFRENNGDPMMDYPIAQGTSGAWTYRKWRSGISECWRTTASTTISFGGTTGLGCWYATSSPAFDFPPEAGFIAPPTVTQTCNSGGAIIVSSITSVTATQVKLTYGRFYGGNDDYSVTFHIHAYGRWMVGPAVDLISFSIDGTSYQAERGMTWREWCSSSYNTKGLTPEDDNNAEYTLIVDSSGNYMLAYNSGSSVSYAKDTIEDGGVYVMTDYV